MKASFEYYFINEMIEVYKPFFGKSIEELFDPNSWQDKIVPKFSYNYFNDGTESLSYDETYLPYNAYLLFSGSFWESDSRVVAVCSVLNPLSALSFEEFESSIGQKGLPGVEEGEPYLSYSFDNIDFRVYTDAAAGI